MSSSEIDSLQQEEHMKYCGWTKSLKPWETIVCLCLQKNHHSRVSWVVQDFVHPQYGEPNGRSCCFFARLPPELHRFGASLNSGASQSCTFSASHSSCSSSPRHPPRTPPLPPASHPRKRALALVDVGRGATNIFSSSSVA